MTGYFRTRVPLPPSGHVLSLPPKSDTSKHCRSRGSPTLVLDNNAQLFAHLGMMYMYKRSFPV